MIYLIKMMISIYIHRLNYKGCWFVVQSCPKFFGVLAPLLRDVIATYLKPPSSLMSWVFSVWIRWTKRPRSSVRFYDHLRNNAVKLHLSSLDIIISNDLILHILKSEKKHHLGGNQFPQEMILQLKVPLLLWPGGPGCSWPSPVKPSSKS